MQFEKKIAIVTGSSSGIGKAVANQLMHEGATVIGIDVQDKGSEASLILNVMWEMKMR